MTIETLEIHLQDSSEGLHQEIERVALVIHEDMKATVKEAGHVLTTGLFMALLTQAYKTAKAMYEHKIEQSRKAEAA